MVKQTGKLNLDDLIDDATGLSDEEEETSVASQEEEEAPKTKEVPKKKPQAKTTKVKDDEEEEDDSKDKPEENGKTTKKQPQKTETHKRLQIKGLDESHQIRVKAPESGNINDYLFIYTDLRKNFDNYMISKVPNKIPVERVKIAGKDLNAIKFKDFKALAKEKMSEKGGADSKQAKDLELILSKMQGHEFTLVPAESTTPTGGSGTSRVVKKVKVETTGHVFKGPTTTQENVNDLLGAFMKIQPAMENFSAEDNEAVRKIFSRYTFGDFK